MGLNENYSELREKAIKWLNTDKKDFKTGLAILQETGYKPLVASKIAKWGKESKHAREKLLHVMYTYVRMWADPESEQHQDENTGDDESKNQDPEVMEDDAVTKLCDDNGYPSIVRRALHEFYALLKERSAMKAEADMIDGDDEETNEIRRSAYEKVEAHSLRMDVLWKAYETFKANGTEPSEEIFTPSAPGKDTTGNGNTDKDPLLDMDLEALKKLKKNEGVKLTRARMMLEYQKETKQPEANPMPEGPKRVKYEKKVADLEAYIQKIDYLIVGKS